MYSEAMSQNKLIDDDRWMMMMTDRQSKYISGKITYILFQRLTLK